MATTTTKRKTIMQKINNTYIKPPHKINNERVMIDLYDRLGRQIDGIRKSLTLNGLTDSAPEAAFLGAKYNNTCPDCDWDYINNDIYHQAQQILRKLEIQRQSVAMWIHFYRCRRNIATCPDAWEDFLVWDAQRDNDQYAMLGITINA